MNKKNSSAWVLCPSKSFPGKLYYFNVITGEAAWCLTEDEKKALAKDVAIKKVSDKNHSYPEPNTPPIDDGPNTSNICYNFTSQSNLPINYHMGPVTMFGQPVFSRYIPNQYMPGYVIPMPQMFVPPVSNLEPKKRSFDQITQTSDIQVPCVPGYTIPLSKRFGTYRQQNVGTKIFGSKSKCGSTQNKGDIFTSNKDNWCSMDNSEVSFGTVQGGIFGPKLINCNEIKASTSKHNLFNSNLNNTVKTNTNKIIKEPVLNIDRKENFIVQNITNSNQRDVIRKSILTQDTEKDIKNKRVTVDSATNTEIELCLTKSAFNNENSNKNKENWVQTVKSDIFLKEPTTKLVTTDVMIETEDETNNAQMKLKNDDLRFVLQAKRRKLKPGNLDTPVQTKDMLSTSQQFNNNLNNLKVNIKQVRFDLDDQIDEEKEEEIVLPEESDVQTLESVETHSATPQVINISYLKSLAKPFMKMDPWYVVVDIGVLLDDFEFIEDFVKKDATCRLLVPNSVRSYIETMSVGEYGGRSWVLLARKAMRRLKTLEDIVVLQPPIMETSSTSAIDGTIECCLQVLESNHAALITTETELYTKGVASGIHTFKLDDIKNSPDPEPQFTLNKGNSVEIQNDNIFMQNTDNFEVFPLSKSVCVPENNSDIFKVPTTIKKRQRKALEINKVDNSNNITGITLNKIKLIRKKFNVNDKVESNTEGDIKKDNVKDKVESKIAEDIKLLSLHDNTPQNDKLSDNLKSIPQRYVDFNIRKIIVNDIHCKDTKVETNLQNPKPDRRRIFEEPILNPHNLNGLGEVSSSSEFGMKIKPLAITVSIKPQCHSSKKEGHGLKINAYTLEDLLKKYNVKDAAMSQRIECRLDEWVCWYHQIIEDCLSDVLMNNRKETQNKLSAPWSLLEAVLCVKEVYSDDTAIKTIADKLCNILSDLSDKNDNLTNKIKSSDFMKLFGCGALLVDSLKTALPESVQVVESQKLLNTLLQHIQDSSTDIELPFNPMRVIRSEMDDTEELKRNIFVKKPSEIIEYLKVHFPAWKDFDETLLPSENISRQEKKNPNEKTVVRTFGKSLNAIRINHTKKITLDDIPLQNTPETKDNIQINTRKELTKITRILDSVQNDLETVNTKDKCNNDMSKHTDKDLTTAKDNTEATSYRNWKDSIQDESLDCVSGMYHDNCPPNLELDDNATPFDDVEMGEHNDDNDMTHNDGINNDISLFEEVNDVANDKENCNDSTVDSGFVNQSLDACSFIRLFLAELSASFKLIYTFIDDSIQEFRCDGVQQKDKKVLYDKANETHLYVADIIGKLKRIIDREAGDNTKLKSLIINAGVEALTDKRMTRYRQVTMKCLEQAQLLERALKTMLALTNEHCDITAVDIDNTGCHVPYFNIFE